MLHHLWRCRLRFQHLDKVDLHPANQSCADGKVVVFLQLEERSQSTKNQEPQHHHTTLRSATVCIPVGL